MARLGLLLTAIAALGAVPAVAEGATLGTDGAGFGGTRPERHLNFFNRDAVVSACSGQPVQKTPTLTDTTASNTQYDYFRRGFKSNVEQSACVTVTFSTMCAAANERMLSETYSPAYDPANITTNWIADLGDYIANGSSYSFVVSPGAPFQTVIDEGVSPGQCAGVTATWTSDRPWAFTSPFIDGVPALGQSLKADADVWVENPSVQRQWLRCDPAGANCSDIPGATASEYTPAGPDLGNTIRVRESATDGSGTSTSLSRATNTAFIPIKAHTGQALGPGDASQRSRFTLTGPASACGTAKPVPTLVGTDLHLFDSYALTSLINEPACIRVAKPFLTCFDSQLVAYDPGFNPASIAQNYLGDDARTAALSYTLPVGHTAVNVIADTSSFPNACPSYDLVIGSDAPFATARPQLDATATAGTPIGTSNGAWSGSPAFSYEWLRCDASGAGCAPIAGAAGAAYTPVQEDVGQTIRSRVTATQINTASADSAPSAVIAQAPPGAPGAPGGPGGGGPGGGGAGAGDRTGPKARLALKRTTLQKILKSGYLPVTATCDEACAITLRADVTRKLGKRLGGVKIASGKAKGQAGKRVTIKVKLTRKARKGLRRMKSVAFTLKATATDAAGNNGAAKKKAKVKRKR
jgi:hypothetical protein